MRKISLLDCTLRDGGYINNWNFGYEIIQSIIKNLIEAETDYIEIGFLRNCDYSKDVSLFNNIAEARNVLPEKKGKSKYSIMALHNLYDLDKLEDNDGTVDAVRVTFHNYDIDEGLAFVKKTIDKGYNVFCNPINIMGYSDKELLTLIEKINSIAPFAFSIVDTFGSMMKSDLLRIYSMVEHNLEKSIQIGLHLHENLGLSYSLAQNFIEICAPGRNSVIDGSLFGMGRVPGNLCIELMMDYLNRYYGGNYNPNAAYDAIDDYILRWKEIEAWGYSTAYALSAKYNLHRNYSEFLLNKGNLRAKDINLILAGIAESKKAAFDKDYIDSLYLNYQNNTIDDREAKHSLAKVLKGREILILAPGYSLKEHKSEIQSFIYQSEPIIFAANFNDCEFGAKYSFYSNKKRYEQYSENSPENDVLVTSNVSPANSGRCTVFNYYDLACDDTGTFDNSVIMLLRLFAAIGIKKVNIAGFDGYTSAGSNYAYNHHITDNKDRTYNNKLIANCISKMRTKIEINFITPSFYNR